MRLATRLSRLGVTLAGSLLVASTATGVVLAAAAKADYTLTASPTSQTVAPRQSASYSIGFQPSNGYSQPIPLTVAPVAGLQAALAPSTISKTSPTAVLTVTAGAATPPGTLRVRVQADSTHYVDVVVTVPTASSSLTLSPTPSATTMLPGSTASYAIAVTPTTAANGLTLTASGVPSGATATFLPPPSGSSAWTLEISTKKTVAAGNYTISVKGSTGSDVAYTTVGLVMTDSGKSFIISGNTTDLMGPGMAPARLNLAVQNPNNQPVTLSNITVSVQSVQQAAGAHGSCDASDYVVTQMSGAVYSTLTSVPAMGTRTLADLGATSLPTIGFADKPANQDGCKGATVRLAYTGTGQG